MELGKRHNHTDCNAFPFLLCHQKKLFGMVEQDENLSLLTKAALSQLASLSGNIFPDTSHRVQYLKTFLELLVPHMKKYTAMISAMGPSSSLSPPFGVQVTGLCNVLVCISTSRRDFQSCVSHFLHSAPMWIRFGLYPTSVLICFIKSLRCLLRSVSYHALTLPLVSLNLSVCRRLPV